MNTKFIHAYSNIHTLLLSVDLVQQCNYIVLLYTINHKLSSIIIIVSIAYTIFECNLTSYDNLNRQIKETSNSNNETSNCVVKIWVLECIIIERYTILMLSVNHCLQ